MFFGKEVKTNQNKATAMTMDTDVKLSQAVLDPSTKGNKKEPVCLLAEIQGKSFILAVLDPAQSWQCPLDLMLAAGTEVKFYLRGQGTIHLTGYEFRDDEDDDFEMSMSSDEMEDDEESADEAESKHAAKKIKVKNSPATNGVKHNALKMKPSGDENGMQDSDDDDDDSDDEDLSFGSDDEELESSDMDDVDLDGLSSDGSQDDEEGDDDDDDDDNDEEDDDDDEESD